MTAELRARIFYWLGCACLLALLLGALAACAAGGIKPPPAAPALGNAATLLDLPAPLELAKQVSLTDAGRVRQGAQYEPAPAYQRLTAVGRQALFSPDYPAAGFDGLAFGIYSFALDGFTGDSLDFGWELPPGDGELWLALGNYVSGSWDWQAQAPGAALSVADMSPYLHPETQLLLLVVACTGKTETQLNWLRWGDNIGPAADLQAAPLTGDTPLNVDFDASASLDPDGEIVLYEWDWHGDGSYDVSGPEPQRQHIYAKGGNYLARVRVKGSDSLTATDTVNVVCFGGGPINPVAVLEATPALGNIPLTVDFDASGSYDDGEIEFYEWDLDGDGEFSEADNGELDFRTLPTAQYEYTEVGSYSPAVRVRDADMNFDTESAVITAEVHGWYFVTVDRLGDTGQYLDVEVVDGLPAIAYRRWYVGLIYVRATDADGMHWGAPQTLDSFQDSGKWNSLQIVDGQPAISYISDVFDGSYPSKLMYIRASDAQGTAWGAPQTLHEDLGNVGGQTGLLVVGGNPAVSYHDGGPGDLLYIRAMDSVGSSWGAPQTVDSSGDAGHNTRMLLVNGNPAIGYQSDNGTYKFVRATDSLGTAWGSPVTVGSGNVGDQNSLAIINGNPAVTYHYATITDANQRVYYSRATNPEGTAWSSPIILAGEGVTGRWSCLAEIEGQPWVSYINATDGWTTGIATILRAEDATGASWGEEEQVDATAGATAGYTSLQIINGHLTLAYYKGANPGRDLIFAIYYP